MGILQDKIYKIKASLFDGLESDNMVFYQNDTDQCGIIVDFYGQGSAAFDLSGSTAVCIIDKKDGKQVLENLVIDPEVNNRASCLFNSNSIACPGKNTLTIIVYGEDGERQTFGSLRFKVNKDMEGNGVESTTEYTALTRLISDTNAIKNEIEYKLANGDFKGEDGAVGATGPQGEQGIQGPQGEKGDTPDMTDFENKINEQYETIVTEFDKAVANVTNGNENATNSEIVQARGEEVNLNARLTKFDSRLEHIVNDKTKYKNILELGFDIGVNTSNSVTLEFTNAINYCVENNIRPFIPKGEYLFTPELQGGVRYNCWVVPDGLDAYFEKGAIFRLVDDPKIEAKLVNMGNNVKFYGELTLIGNSKTGVSYGEMQSNMFIYKKKNVYIERLISMESWGDNLFIGGENTSNADLSKNIKIDYFEGTDAKRKNLVFQHCTDVYIKTAYLDNSLYGINSLDVEPDNWHLSTLCCTNTIDYLYVKGTGIDLTANTDSATAKNYIVNINKFVCDVTKSSAAVLLTYAITLNIKEFILNSVADGVVINRLIDTTYGSFINIDNIVLLTDKINQLLRMSASNGAFQTMQYPIVKIGKIIFERTETFYDGILIDNSGGKLYIDSLKVNNHNQCVIKCNNTSKICELYANDVEFVNCGKEGSAIIILDRINGDSYTDYINITEIKQLNIIDDRTDVNIYAVIQFNEPETSERFKLYNLKNPNAKTIINSNGILNPAMAVTIAGFDGYPKIVSVRKNPEGYVVANKGSLAICTDGKLYIKSTDGTNTGWLEK